MFYVNYNGKEHSLTDFYTLINGVQPAKRTIHKGISPPTDVLVSDDQLDLEYELAGVNPEDILIQVDNNILLVEATKVSRPINSDKNQTVERSERILGKYSRSFTVGDIYDLSQLKAEYINGILYITIPKKPESRPKTFKVFVNPEAKKELKS